MPFPIDKCVELPEIHLIVIQQHIKIAPRVFSMASDVENIESVEPPSV